MGGTHHERQGTALRAAGTRDDGDRLGSSIEFAAEAMTLRLGYESRSTATENRTFTSSGGENVWSVGSWFEMLTPDVSRGAHRAPLKTELP
jgi:hypothetical protein